MRKIISVITALIIVLSLASCSAGTGKDSGTNEGKVTIVTTVFPIYDWVRNVVGENENVDITMLLDTGVDLHSFQPTADDLMKISTCDLFVYVGGESDEWAEDAMETVSNDNAVYLNLMEELKDIVKEEEVKEGMQAEEEEEGEEETEYDEHIWLSLKNAAKAVALIEASLEKLDGENAEAYKTNAESYLEKISSLDARYEETVESAEYNTLVFGDRFPFRYMTEDYGIDYYAAFVGCSAESEASFETITFLAEKVDELNLKSVMTLEGTDHSIAETIVANTKDKNQRILSLNSLQSVTKDDVENGADYLNIMEENLNVLSSALN